MPLRDHFRSPVNDKHSWDEVHGLWPGMIVRQLFDLLPPGYQSAPGIHLGSPFEIDVAAYEDDSHAATGGGSTNGGVAVAPVEAPTFTVEADWSEQDEYEVRVYDADRGRQLVATIEIVSPSNKDRPDKRAVFTGKVAALLQQGVCVSLVDMVSVRRANLYAELLTALGHADPSLGPEPPYLYAVTMRGRKRRKQPPLLDAWFFPLTVGRPMPTLPLWLAVDLHVSLPLDPSYEETCRLLRIP